MARWSFVEMSSWPIGRQYRKPFETWIPSTTFLTLDLYRRRRPVTNTKLHQQRMDEINKKLINKSFGKEVHY